MYRLLTILIISWSSLLWAAPDVHVGGILGKDEGFPWPWGVQCNFPMEEAEGTWRITKAKPEVHLEFKIVQQLRPYQKYLQVTQYDSENEIIARGFGHHQKKYKGIVVLMWWHNEVFRSGYWLNISRFVDNSKGGNKSCSKTKDHKYGLKVIPFGEEQDSKFPLLLEKLPKHLWQDFSYK